MSDIPEDLRARAVEAGHALRCSQCGNRYVDLPTCGPTHAILRHEVTAAPYLSAQLFDAQAIAARRSHTIDRLSAELAEARATIDRIEALADSYQARLPDGTGNGRAYNAHQVASAIRAALRGDW